MTETAYDITAKASELKPIFDRGAPIRAKGEEVRDANGKLVETKPGKFIGRGYFETDLVQMGFTKRELKRLEGDGILSKVTTTFKGAWRTTFVMHMPVELGGS